MAAARSAGTSPAPTTYCAARILVAMKFDPPRFEKKRQVSLWVGTRPADELPKGYFKAQPKSDGRPLSGFAGDFGLGFHDEDIYEVEISTAGPRPVGLMIGGHSWATSFIQEADLAASEAGLEQCEYLVLVYDLDYRPDVTGRHANEWLRFVGTFPYELDANWK
jgi:hypothetical protein